MHTPVTSAIATMSTFSLCVTVHEEDEICEELWVQPVYDAFKDVIDNVVESVQAAYLDYRIPECVCTTVRALLSDVQFVKPIVNGKPVNVVRDCRPQLLLLLLEKCTPESYAQLLSLTDADSPELMQAVWAFLGPSGFGDVPSQSWVYGHPDIQPARRNSPEYRLAMRCKFTAIAIYLFNEARSARDYDDDMLEHTFYFHSYGRRAYSWPSDMDHPLMFALEHISRQRPDELLVALLGMNAPVPLHRVAKACTSEPVQHVASLCTVSVLQQLILNRLRDTFHGRTVPLFRHILQVRPE